MFFFFTNYLNQPKILGTTTSSDYSSHMAPSPVGWCGETSHFRGDPVDSCTDPDGVHIDSCDGNVYKHYSCDPFPHIYVGGKYYCVLNTDYCNVGAKCVNKRCTDETPYMSFNSVSHPLFMSSHFIKDPNGKSVLPSQPPTTWCISSNLGCEDHTGRYLNSCKNDFPQTYVCDHTFDNKSHLIFPLCRKSEVGTCATQFSLSPTQIIAEPEKGTWSNPLGTDGTWCKTLDNNSTCQDNNGTYHNFCSGKTAQKYFCTFTRATSGNTATSIKCVVGDFPCDKSCNQGVCGDGVDRVPTILITPAPTRIMTSMPSLIPTNISTTTAAIPTTVPTLIPTIEPIPTTFNPTPHRANVSFWQHFFNWFSFNKQ